MDGERLLQNPMEKIQTYWEKDDANEQTPLRGRARHKIQRDQREIKDGVRVEGETVEHQVDTRQM